MNNIKNEYNHKRDDLYSLLLQYHPEIDPIKEPISNGIEWKQESKDINASLKADIERWMGDYLSEFYWHHGIQYVYIKGYSY